MTSVNESPVEAWDVSQGEVIESGASVRLIVEAGPGTGKTAVACARLAALINEHGVQPSRVWMISFTRTAVAEIRARLYRYLGESAFAVKVATVDAHAWKIHSGYDAAAHLTGSYEENIDHVLSLIRSDPEVQEYLESVEHLVVDEAQDLTGCRADLVEALIDRLSVETGVTIFADQAQAIYGFSEDEQTQTAGLTLLARIGGAAALGFRSTALKNVHRTSAPGLLRIFTDVRARVLAGVTHDSSLFADVRNGIIAHADSGDLKLRELKVSELPASSLVLFRTRAEALETSQYCSAPHALRLSGYGSGLPAWPGVCFYDFIHSHMDKQDFADRWNSRVVGVCQPDYDVHQAWERLMKLGGSGDGSLVMRQLRARLGSYAPPVELATQEYGLPGPVIGTIHASKGREADNVILMMPDPDEFEDAGAEEEESRVLFVGSTRARATLNVGQARKWRGSQIETGRAYRMLAAPGKCAAMVEIGRAEDIVAAGLVGRSFMEPEAVASAQSWLVSHSGKMVDDLRIAQDGEQKWNYRLFRPDPELNLGWCTCRLRDDMWSIANLSGARKGLKLRPPGYVRYIKLRGCRTVALAPDDPQLADLHAPWAQSGFLLAPRFASFTRAEFKKASK